MDFQEGDTDRVITCWKIQDYGEVKFIAEVFPVLEIRKFPAGRLRSAIGQARPGFGTVPGVPRRASTS